MINYGIHLLAKQNGGRSGHQQTGYGDNTWAEMVKLDGPCYELWADCSTRKRHVHDRQYFSNHVESLSFLCWEQ